jgi:hypothetical protein
MNKYYGAIIFVVLIIACSSLSNKALANESDFALFNQLALAETGLDFPHSKDRLETCRRVEDIPCLHSFRSFKEAKAKLLHMPRPDALELTLKWLSESCMVEPPADFEYVCIGTVLALSFFPDEAEDIRIRQFLSQLPQSTRENVFDRSVSLNVSWLENRSNDTAWRSWLESELLDTRIKSHAIRRLENPVRQSNPLHEFLQNKNGK